MNRPKIFILVGLPASGKSTKSKELVDSSKNTFRVNKDSIRQMLHFKDWNPKHEGLVESINNMLVHYLIAQGKNVVIDNMNLFDADVHKYEKDFFNIANIEVIKMDTSVDECIKRDDIRKLKGERFVGKNVILNQAWVHNIYRSPHNCLVSDLDGTLCNCEKRRHFVRNVNNDPNWKKDWGAFYKLVKTDIPNPVVVDKITKAKESGLDVILVSGRPEYVRKDTEDWLIRYQIPYDRLLMRASNDSRPDEVVKQEILDKYLDKSKITCVLDDRPKVIRMWKQNGLTVEEFGDGTEF